MAKKDELLENKNNEADGVSDDTSLEKKDIEELQEDFSSIFNQDYDETEDAKWEENHERFPLLPFLGKKGNYTKDFDSDEEKSSKKKKFPWSKKREEKEEASEEKTESIENPVEEKEEPVKDVVETEIVEDKEEVKPVVEDDETMTEEIVEDVSAEVVVEEVPDSEEKQEEVVEEISSFEEKQEEVVEEITSFEEEQEVIEEIPSFEEEQEKVIEELPPLEEEQEVLELPSFEEEQEVIEELPSFEEEQEVIEEIPPFEEEKIDVVKEFPHIVFEAKKEEKTEEIVTANEVAEVKPVEQKKVKEQKEEETIQEKEPEPLTKKDHFTVILALVALLFAIAFVCVKFFLPINNNNAEVPEITTEASSKLSEIQVVRQGSDDNYIQSDLKNVYYSFSGKNEVKYYEYDNNTMNPLHVAGIVSSQLSMDNGELPIELSYVKTDNGVFGITVFRTEDNPGSTIHNVITFKLVNLPEKYDVDGKALLLAVANSESASRRYNLWTDSFVVDLNSGEATRFLTANQDSESYSVAYSVLTISAFATDGEMIPFFTTREYDDGSGKKDLFVKNGEEESLFATDVYGEYLYADKDVIAYLKTTATGFDVVKKEDSKEEKRVFSLYGSFSTDYLYHQEYLLNKYNGNLYNAKTGEEIALAGYRMSSVDMMSVSPDGRYLVVIGTVNSAADYQVHVFDLEKNEYAKYEDLNFSHHHNLTFVDDTKVMYMVVDPHKGYEHVIVDVSKAF